MEIVGIVVRTTIVIVGLYVIDRPWWESEVLTPSFCCWRSRRR